MFLSTPQVKIRACRVQGDFISLSCLRFAQRQFCFASPLTGSTWVLLPLGLQTGENIYNTGFLCRHHFYTMDFFFSLPISSKYIYEDSLSFIFVIAFSVVMIETKFRNLKGNSGAMENHVYTKDFFLSYLFLLPLNNKEDCYS